MISRLADLRLALQLLLRPGKLGGSRGTNGAHWPRFTGDNGTHVEGVNRSRSGQVKTRQTLQPHGFLATHCWPVIKD